MKEVSRKQGPSTSPCAACKLLRRRCANDCIFAPYFPAEEPQKFANVHKVFGASNVSKMLQELQEHHMVYEANARLRDPVYGCVGAISSLQHQIDVLQTQLAIAQAEMVRLRLWQKVYLAAAAAGDAAGAAAAPGAGHHPSKLLAAAEPHPKAIFAMDVAVDQVLAMDEPMWSC